MEAEVDEEEEKKEEDELKAFRETWNKDYTPEPAPKPCQVCKRCEECKDRARKIMLCEACKRCDDCKWTGQGAICDVYCEICNECKERSERIRKCGEREKLMCKWCREYRDEKEQKKE